MEPVIINEYLYNRGRGVELRTCRITVHDIFPYIHAGIPDEEILKWQPSINTVQLQAIKAYIASHYEQLAEHDERIELRNARGTAVQATPQWNLIIRGTSPLRQKLLEWERDVSRNPALIEEIEGETPSEYAIRYMKLFAKWQSEVLEEELCGVA